MNVKIISFNISSSNLNIKDDLNVLLNLNADIYCVQELLQEHILLVKQLFNLYEIFTCQESFYNQSKEKRIPKSEQYNCILVKKSLKILNSNIIKHIPFFKHPLLYKLILHSNTSVIESLYVDIELYDIILRVVNIHLESFTSPSFREDQLLHIFKHVIDFNNKSQENSKPYRVCICGDFNSFAALGINFLVGYFLQYSFKDFIINEKKNLCILAKDNHLNYYKFNKSTFKRFPLELDGVLYSKELKKYLNAQILKISTSSDHYIIQVKIDDI
ncbi:MAG: hypothetical protein ACMXYB_02725 [Candidatus Woesearchaeota archaeon]